MNRVQGLALAVLGVTQVGQVALMGYVLSRVDRVERALAMSTATIVVPEVESAVTCPRTPVESL